MPTPAALELPHYAELYCQSNFSFLQRASHPEELVNRAAHLGYSALALTDECSVAGIVRAHVEALKHNLHLIVGSAFRVQIQTDKPPLQLILLAQNREGYGNNLCELINLSGQSAQHCAL